MAVLSTSANIATPGLPVGSIQAFAGANAPTGWLLCDGSAVRRGDYPDLYNTLGTQYGSGDGATTFNIPDLRGRVPAGKDNMGGTAAGRLTSAVSGVAGTALGSSGGSQNIPDHSHQSYIRLFEYYNDAILGQSGATGAGGYNSRTATWATWQHPTTTISGITVNDYTGRSTPASTWVSQTNMVSDGPSYQQTPQNVQPTLVVNYIIKAVADIARGGWYTQSSPPVVTQLPSNPAIGEEVYHFSSNKYVHKRYNGTSWDEFAINQSSLPPGSVVQVGRYGWTNETSVNGSGAGWVNATNSSYTFTPQFSNSTILIQFEWAMAPYNTGGQYTGMSCRGLWAGNVVTVQGANGGATHEVYFANAASNGADLYTRTVKSASFTSNTTSPTIITTQVAAYVGTTNARLNQNVNWPSYYTVWEIKG